MRLVAFGFMATLALMSVPATVIADRAPPREKPDEKKEEVKLPWTVEEIRKDWGTARRFKMNITAEDDLKGARIYDCENITEKGFKLTGEVMEDGEERAGSVSDLTWDKFLSEFRKIIADGSATEEKVAVPAGSYDCTCYTQRKGNRTMKMWLSKSLPGMFVKMENTRDDKKDFEHAELAEIGVPLVKWPWTRQQVREHWKKGLHMAYDVVSGPESGVVGFSVTEADKEGYTGTTYSQKGDERREEEPSKRTWDRYFAEFAAPREGSTVGEETLETPAGKFECVKVTYTKKGESHETNMTLYASKTEPGIFVKVVMSETRGEKKEEETWTLKQYKSGK
jgi:hypothetical protein